MKQYKLTEADRKHAATTAPSFRVQCSERVFKSAWLVKGYTIVETVGAGDEPIVKYRGHLTEQEVSGTYYGVKFVDDEGYEYIPGPCYVDAFITPYQARKLRRLIRNFADMQEADSWKGGGDPDEVSVIEKKYKEAKRKLFSYLKELTHD